MTINRSLHANEQNSVCDLIIHWIDADLLDITRYGAAIDQ